MPRTKRPVTPSLLMAIVLLGVGTPPAWSDLTPEEIAVVYARGNRESEGLARYYCRERGVPLANLCPVDVAGGETIERELWTWSVRPEIHKWIEDNDPKAELRCLVTTWGIPLKIAPDPSTEANRAYADYLAAEREHRLGLLEEIGGLLDRLGGGDPLTQRGDAVPDDTPPLKRAQQRLEAALKAAQARVGAMPVDGARRSAEARLQQYAAAAGGATVLLQGYDQQLKRYAQGDTPAPPALSERFNVLRGQSSSFNEVRRLLEARAPGYERDALLLAMLERSGGQFACLEWLAAQSQIVKKNETGASLDSELSLVMWPDDYATLRWQPNYLKASYDNFRQPAAYRTLMVARLDAPTLKLAKGLIDAAVSVEKEGLAGRAYFDARGLATLDGPPRQPGSYPDYDLAVLATAKGLGDAAEQTGIEVTLNDQAELFQPGECPDAALYCGWYSLAKYVDAFDWAPGAVAYHLASSEASTLHDADSQVWCKRMLEDGVAATIGPVYEPYLAAFPRPNEFFALLLQGDLTLVEVYYRTKPYNSWMMTLVGDPLYRPFAKRASGGR